MPPPVCLDFGQRANISVAFIQPCSGPSCDSQLSLHENINMIRNAPKHNMDAPSDPLNPTLVTVCGNRTGLRHQLLLHHTPTDYNIAYVASYYYLVVIKYKAGSIQDVIRRLCFCLQPFKDEAQTALFKDPVRTAL